MPEVESNGTTALALAGLDDVERVSLCEALDRVLNKGAVIAGEVVISVADVELVYLGLQVVLSSVETARGTGPGGPGLTIDIGKERPGAFGRSGSSRV